MSRSECLATAAGVLRASGLFGGTPRRGSTPVLAGRGSWATGGAAGRVMSAIGRVYAWCMSRTNIDIDEDACQVIMRRYHLATKRDAVNFALRTVAGEPLSLERARSLRGSGWNGDLDEMRTDRAG